MTNQTATSNDLPRLKQLLAQQLDLYQQLRALTREQSNFIQQGQAESLLTVLAKRQRVIDALSKITTELQPFRDQWQTLWASLSPSDQQEIAPLVKQAEQELAAIIEQDKHDRDQIEDAKDQVGKQLSQTVHQGAALQAYGASGVNQSARYTNRQG